MQLYVSSELSHTLLRITGDNETAHQLESFILAKWPQVNHKTHLALGEWHTITVTIPGTLNIPAPTHPIRKGGWKARLWRIAGEIFNQQRWLEQGTSWVIPPIIPDMPKLYYPMEGYGWQVDTPSQIVQGGLVYLAYTPLDDTLYIREVK